MKVGSSVNGRPAHTPGLDSPHCDNQSASSMSKAPQADRHAGDNSRSCIADVGPDLAAETAPDVNVDELRMMHPAMMFGKNRKK